MNTYFENQSDTQVRWQNFVDLLIDRGNNQADQTAYTFLHRGETEQVTLTYGELDLKARAIAAQLQSLEAAGERALLLYSPGMEFISAFFGCLYAGVVAVPAYPPRRNQKMARLESIVRDAETKVVLTSSDLLSKIQSQLAENPDLQALHWVASDSVDNEIASAWQQPRISGDTLAFLQYTSGSTGTPKGVAIAHSNLLHNEQIIAKAFGHTEDMIGVGWLPLFHDMGLIGNVLQPLYMGRPCILMSPADFLQKPLRWLQAISKYRATTSGGPNFAYDLCVDKTTPEQRAALDLSSWNVAFNGAEPVRAATLERFAAAFAPCGFRPEAFYPCYGMAETTLFVTGGKKNEAPPILEVAETALEQNQIVVANGKKDNVKKIVSCGWTWLGQQVAIANPETLTRCAPEEVGEIWVAGESVAQGYWNRTEATQQTFRAHLADTNEGPFLRTGDLGFMRDGELFVTGRLKDMIIINGQNYYPHDIEFTVENCHQSLRPACGAAFSVEVKRSERLVIVHEVERSYLRKLNVKEVVDCIRETVAREHNLQTYAVVLVKTGSIPKTSSGKIQRHKCKSGFLAGSLNVVDDWSENPQNRMNFLQLQAEVESMIEKLQKPEKLSN